VITTRRPRSHSAAAVLENPDLETSNRRLVGRLRCFWIISWTQFRVAGRWLFVHFDGDDYGLTVEVSLDHNVDLALITEYGVAEELRLSDRDPRLGEMLSY
jgi:hypothetical protein